MTPVRSDIPQLMPVLSRGKHRNPRSGGCFMEFASYLAGEAWSDHPDCTHPVLASLARMVNDCTSDRARSRLTALIPSVIGLRGVNPRVGLLIALRAATSALPVANAERQRALAVGILACEHDLADFGDLPHFDTAGQIRSAFEKAPDTERWAREFISSIGSWTRTGFTNRTADAIVLLAVQGIARACVPDADERLHDLLVSAIHDFAAATTPVEAKIPVSVSA
jgi:hypothetical protein